MKMRKTLLGAALAATMAATGSAVANSDTGPAQIGYMVYHFMDIPMDYGYSGSVTLVGSGTSLPVEASHPNVESILVPYLAAPLNLPGPFVVGLPSF